ncbi:hypothetical protein [Shewanella aestuarii]|uniref:Uncharacterized protein n=1 Tax=Shewanella aestuarii TaxID=1028752 RepID=A0A6G9QMX4_9GAMM|nr:hypothetical protein [Shewanella aestuarii]QIR15832.1 hypothetical protein HBH39_16175 [Shewanella aestuarii]
MEQRPHRLLTRFRTKPMKSVSVLLATTSLLMISSFALPTSTHSNATQACVCKSDTTYNTSLPSNHPTNRCATQQHDVSWKNWITGNSRSGQFHFIDLIELLYGHKDKPLSDIPTPSKPEQL